LIVTTGCRSQARENGARRRGTATLPEHGGRVHGGKRNGTNKNACERRRC